MDRYADRLDRTAKDAGTAKIRQAAARAGQLLQTIILTCGFASALGGINPEPSDP